MKRNFKKGMVVLLLLMLFVMNSFAQTQPAPLNLREAIQTALSNNYGLKSDSMNVVAAAYQKTVAKADNLPQVNYSSKTEYNPAIAKQMFPGKYVGQPDKDVVAVQFGSQYSMSHGVEVNQNLFRKDLKLKVSSADLNTSIARTKNNLSKEELIYQAASSYYDLQSSAELISTTESDYKSLMRTVAIAKAQVANGTLKKIDYESLEISAANMESQLNQLQSKYDVQLSYFKYLLGLPVDAALSIEANSKDLADLQLAREKQVEKRTELFLNRQMIQAKELELKTIRAERLPVTSAYFRFAYQSQYNSSSDAFNNDYWYKTSTVGLSTKLSLFDGYRRKNRMNIVRSELQQLRFQREYTTQQANTDWNTASTKLNNDLKQYSITKKNLGLAEKVFSSRQALYTEGVSSLIELLDAERELSEARNNHTQSKIDVQTGILDTHKANGTLLNEFLKSL